MKRFRTDGGGEYTFRKFTAYLELKGIIEETTTAYTAWYNGVVDRANHMILERGQCMQDDAGLSKKY